MIHVTHKNSSLINGKPRLTLFVILLFTFLTLCCLPFLRDQDLAEALDSGGSDMEMERGIVQVQEQSAQHRAKMWKVRRGVTGIYAY